MTMGVSRRLVEPALLRMMQDEDPASRQQAMATLAAVHASDEPALAALAAALKDPVREVRAAAAGALGEISWKAQPAVPALIEALKDESPALRSTAAKALGLIGPPARAAGPELKRLSDSDPDFSVSVAARDALAKVQSGR